MPQSHSSLAIVIRRVAPELIRPLRAAILRPGRPASESVYPFDDHPEAAHFGAFDAHGRIIGSASVFHEAAAGEHVPGVAREGDPWRDPGAWRLRGMTVIEPLRGSGCGRILLQAAIANVVSAGGTCLWFQARTSARGFYERFGFTAVGPVHDAPHIGEHVFMWQRLAERTAPSSLSDRLHS